MDCTSSRKVLKTYLDGELEPSCARAVDEHVKSCPDCRAACTDYRRIAGSIRSALRVAPSPRSVRILERCRWRAREENDIIRSLQRVAAVAAALLVIFVGAAAWSGERSSLSSSSGSPGSASSDNAEVLAIVFTDSTTWENDF
ncbi:MAG TPA: zf-HC2 domain-containing protein [Planctomycetota bacterium]|nr:zf-HC2 domain-containing protein [Planctomycetota bacterium]